VKIKTQKGLSLAFSLINVAGVVGTFISVMKETPEVQKEMDKLPKDASKMTKTITFIKGYKKSLLLATGTIASNICSKIFSSKVEASIIGATTMISTQAVKYKKKVKEFLGIDADKSVVKSIMKDEYKKPDTKAQEGEELYYEEHIGYFYAKSEKIKDAYIKINSNFVGADIYYNNDYHNSYTIGEFMKLCEAIPLSHNLDENKLNFGWSWDYLSEWYEMPWVHMDISEPDENGAHLIYWFEDPIWNPEMWDTYRMGHFSKEEYFNGSEGLVNKDNTVYIQEEVKEE